MYPLIIIGIPLLLQIGSASTLENQVLAERGSNAQIDFKFPPINLGSTVLYATQIFRKSSNGTYKVITPDTIDRYELTTSSPLNVADGCPTTPVTSYCYRCESAGETCVLTLTINDVQVNDTGVYAVTLTEDGEKNTNVPTTNLTVYAKPTIYFRYKGQRYDNFATIQVKEGEAIKIVAHIQDFSPRLIPSCHKILDLTNVSNIPTFDDVITFTQNDTTKLQTIIDEQNLIPTSKMKGTNCTLQSEVYPDIPYYVLFHFEGTEPATGRTDEKEGKSGCPILHPTWSLLLLAVFLIFR